SRGAELCLEVRDTGIGIAPEDIPRALERFSQVDGRLSRKYDGAGLGLPMAKQFMELHGGTLELASTPGAGTQVLIAFPPSRAAQFISLTVEVAADGPTPVGTGGTLFTV